MLDYLFWLAMACVLVLGWPEFVEWRAVRRFRKELKELDKNEDDLSHLQR